ncbi:MAG: LysR family transcriptional regulator [Tateyamaria sp.]
MKIALRVAELGSLSAVAREADVNHSSISRTISALEARLGLRLFQRSSRHLSLTAEGEQYLRRVAPLVVELDEAQREARNDRAKPRGHLRLTASVAYGTKQIVPFLSVLQSKAPELEIELILSDGNFDLVAERIDLAIRLAPAPEGDLISSRLHSTHYHVVASPDWVAQNSAPHDPRSLTQIGCLRGTLPGHRDTWRFRKSGGTDAFDVSIVGQVMISNPLAQVEGAKSGLGPALLADWLVKSDLEAGHLINLFPAYDATATTFDTAAWILYPSRTYLPAKVRVAIDFLRELKR